MNAPLAPETLVFNRYRVVGLAGQGEFGLTYLAQDQQRFDELCILKEFEPPQQNPDVIELQRQQFHQKAAVLYELDHPQLPHYRIMFLHENRLYLVREYINGKSYSAMLHERRAEGRVFSQAEVMQFLLQTLPVLIHIHSLGLIHQNLCPQSVVVRNQDHLPILIDFGLVKYLVARLQLHPVLLDASIGRAGYMAPEQEQGGKVIPGSDLYSLGAVAIALLLGQEPQGQAHRWSRSLNWESQVAIYPEFADVLKRMLHPNPQKRFTSVLQVLKVLEAIAPIVLRSPTGAVYRRTPVQQANHHAANPHQVREGSVSQRQSLLEREVSLSHTNPLLEKQVSDRLQETFEPATPQANAPQRVKRPPLQRSKKLKKQQGGADFRASAVLVVSIALLVSVVSFKALSWVQTEPENSPTPTQPSDPIASESTNSETTTKPEPSPTPAQSPSGQSSRDSLTDRRQQLGVDSQFLADLTDELFYIKHPDLQGQKLSEDQKDLQQEWTTIAQDALTKLESLSPQTRGKLGTYQRADYDRWVTPESGASVNSRELNVLVNNRFGELFPDQKGKTLNPKTLGQIWYALAEEELTKLKPQ